MDFTKKQIEQVLNTVTKEQERNLLYGRSLANGRDWFTVENLVHDFSEWESLRSIELLAFKSDHYWNRRSYWFTKLGLITAIALEELSRKATRDDQ